METPAAGGRAASTGFSLSKSKSFCPVLIKLGEYVGGHNISTKFYNQPNPPGTRELWPLNCPKTELAVSVLQVEYPASKNVVITIEFTTNTTGVFCVNVALLFFLFILLVCVPCCNGPLKLDPVCFVCNMCCF